MIVVIGGPTGSGKTKAAIEVAYRHPAEIVNADSRQIYRGMAIGTNQPTPEEFRRVHHHLFGFVDPDRAFSMADYEATALPVVEDIHRRGRLPVVTGGTGFYIRALLKGVWPVPAKDRELRNRIHDLEKLKGREFLHRLLRRLDPETARKISSNDVYRVVRAIEIRIQSGRKASEVNRPRPDRFEALKVWFNPDPDELERLIEERTGQMFNNGWVDEVKQLISKYPNFSDLPAAGSLGYKEIIEHVSGTLSREGCFNRIVKKTVQYAKRQRTWFRNQDGFTLLESIDELHRKLDSVLQ